jgi:hypothetical protein
MAVTLDGACSQYAFFIARNAPLTSDEPPEEKS